MLILTLIVVAATIVLMTRLIVVATATIVLMTTLIVVLGIKTTNPGAKYL